MEDEAHNSDLSALPDLSIGVRGDANMLDEETVVEWPWRRLLGDQGFGCGRDNAVGLGLTMRARGRKAITSTFTIPRPYESFPGCIHGGVSTTILDELMGNAVALFARKVCFTTSIKTRFMQPMQTDVRYQAEARVVQGPFGPENDMFKAEGEISDMDGGAVISANATFRWVTVEQADAFLRPNLARDPKYASYFRWPS